MKKKSKVINIIIAVFLLAGITVLLYPFLGFWLSERSESYAIQEYDERYAKMQEEEREAEWARAVSYNEQLQAGSIADPFTSSPSETGDDYRSVLDIGDSGMMAYLRIPKINLRLPVYHGTTEEILELGIGHLEGTHLPIGGAGTHAVLTGHTGLQSSVFFTNLTDLEENDEFYIYVLDRVLAYRVDRISVVLPTEIDLLEGVEGEDYVTLVTCTPYGVNSHRLLVRGVRVDYTPDELEEIIADTDSAIGWMTVVLITSLAGFALIITIIFIKYRRNKRRN